MAGNAASGTDHVAAATDVLVVGGGVIGAAVAYFLRAKGFGGSVTVVERDPTYQRATTALSVGGIRQQFSTPENVAMSRFGADFVATAGEHLAVDGEAPALSWVPAGYLVLATAAGLPALLAAHEVQAAHGAENVILDAADLGRRFPFLATDDLAAGSLGLAHEGWLDPNALLHAFRRRARALGARFVHDTVVGLERAGGRIVAARLASGGRLATGAVVNAAGPQAGAVAALAGIALPVGPRKRTVFRVTCPEPVPLQNLLVDPSGVYVRPEHGSYLCGTSPADGEPDPETDDLSPDHALFEEVVWPVLATRIPAFERLRVRNAWAGLYDYNALDQNAVIGPHPEVTNFYFANGFSGHGLQQAPATGRAIAELLVDGRYTTLDLGRFGYERVLRHAPIVEAAVI